MGSTGEGRRVVPRIPSAQQVLRSRRRAAALIGLVVAVAAGCGGFDPAPDRFVVGSSLQGNGVPELWIVSCLPGRLESVEVTEVDSPSTLVWRVIADSSDAPEVTDGEVIRLVTGQAPDGMVSDIALDSLPPAHAELQAGIRMSRQRFSHFFEIGDLESESVLTNGGGSRPMADFDTEVDDY